MRVPAVGTGAPRRRTLSILAVTVVAAATFHVTAAGAGPAPSLQLSPASGPAGTAVAVTGSSFSALSSGTIRFGTTTVGTFTTNRKGWFSTSVSVPTAAAPGASSVTATAGTLSASRTFTVTATSTTSTTSTSTSSSTTTSTTTTTTTTIPATTTTTTPATTTTTVPPPSGAVLLGVSTPSGPYNLSELDLFEQDAGKRAGVLMYFQGWAYDEFNASLAASVAARGTIPEITWEPWDYKLGLDQPAYALARIIDGSHDAYITRWARGAKAYGGPLLVRFAHEMNDRHYPWSEQVNGNQPGQYVAAWRHVVDIFRAEGATNVAWIWAPNVSYAGTTPLAPLYPGDGYVDWIGVDGYNGGTDLPWGGWLTFAQIFGSTLAEIAAITTTKPVMIGETSSAEAGGSKASWITDFFAELRSRPQIQGFVWFNHNKETDWRVQSSEAARLAFASGVADPRYR